VHRFRERFALGGPCRRPLLYAFVIVQRAKAAGRAGQIYWSDQMSGNATQKAGAVSPVITPKDREDFQRYINLFASDPTIRANPDILQKLQQLQDEGKIAYDDSTIPANAIAAWDAERGISVREHCRGDDSCMTELVHEAAHPVYTDRTKEREKRGDIGKIEKREEARIRKQYKGWDPNEEFFCWTTQLKVYKYLRDNRGIPRKGSLEARLKVWEDGKNDDALWDFMISIQKSASEGPQQ
jgi:hypothetical protein